MGHARWLWVALILALPLPTMAQFKVPKIPIPGPGDIEVPVKIPGLDKILQEEPGISTSFADAVTGVAFLDDFRLPGRVGMAEMPRGIGHSFMLAPGGYQCVLQSYCLHAGTHGPGSGEGYLYAQLKGPQAGLISDILANSAAQPQIPQHDIQLLIWGIQARTKISDMSEELQNAARLLLTEDQIRKLNGGALAQIPPELMDRAFGQLPPLVRQVLQAEAQIRNMLSQGVSEFDQIEGIAVLPGEPEGGGEEVPRGRWSYRPGGFLVRYFPSGYSRTLTQVFVPPDVQVTTDDRGRITSVADSSGHRIETDYDDTVEATAVPGDDGVKGYAFGEIRIISPDPRDSTKTRTVTLTGEGFALVGTPSGKGRPERAGGRFAGLEERYKWADAHRQELAGLIANVRKIGESPASEDVTKAILPQMVDLAGYSEALKQAAEGNISDQDKWARRQLGLVKQAWAVGLVAVGDSAGIEDAQTETGRSGQPRRILLASARLGPSLLAVGEMQPLPRPSPWKPSKPKPKRPLKPFNPGGSATPANQGRQRLGQSPRPDEDQSDDEEQDEEEGGGQEDKGSDKDILDRAKNAIDVIGKAKDVFDLMTDPAGFAAGKIGFGVQDQLQSSYFDWLFDTTRKIGQALGGDPPRDDFKTIASVEQIALVAPSWDEDVPPARAAALEALRAALLDLVAELRAGQISVDRLGGAAQAGDEEWTQSQATALLQHKREAGAAMVVVADRLDALLNELQVDEGINDIQVTGDALRAYQERLRNEGFTAVEIQAAHDIGLTDAQIEASLQERLAAHPDGLAGGLLENARAAASAIRDLGGRWSRLPDVGAEPSEAETDGG